VANRFCGEPKGACGQKAIRPRLQTYIPSLAAKEFAYFLGPFVITASLASRDFSSNNKQRSVPTEFLYQLRAVFIW
jgi:hypothetical protein